MKTVTKGHQITRVKDHIAEAMVREDGWKYSTNNAFRKISRKRYLNTVSSFPRADKKFMEFVRRHFQSGKLLRSIKDRSVSIV